MLMYESALLESETTSIFVAAFQEALRHRWIESQKHGRDLGDYAIRDWYDRFWWTFLRYRHIEHVLGESQWEEFPHRSFAAVRPLLDGNDDVAVTIIDLYREGFENLDIINWSHRKGHGFDAVFECLLLINMNDARIDPRFN